MSDKPISDLRRRMIADMTIRIFSDKVSGLAAPRCKRLSRALRRSARASVRRCGKPATG
jgi:hypothetical protein